MKIQDVNDAMTMCSRLKTKGRAMKALGEFYYAACYLKAALALESNLIEIKCLQLEIAYIDIEFLKKMRPDLRSDLDEGLEKIR